MKNTSQHIYLCSTETYREYRQLKCLKDVSDKVFPLLKVFFGLLSLTSVKVQDTARPFLSTWGRLIISFPPWKSTREGSCFERGEVLTLYLRGESKNCMLSKSVTISSEKQWDTAELLTFWLLHCNDQCPLCQISALHSCTWVREKLIVSIQIT